MKWKTISEAPKDGTEILAYREDIGVFIARWTCCAEFLGDRELEEMDDATIFKEDWFYADFISGGRLDESEIPTHFMLLPKGPV